MLEIQKRENSDNWNWIGYDDSKVMVIAKAVVLKWVGDVRD